MTTGIAQDGSRLFRPFFDTVDMILCTGADTPLREIEETASHHGLRFPLVLDSAKSLRDHVAAAEYAPLSARFGPYVDNLTGMNWKLPSGKLIRIGERVVKSTTGYDLFRFLLHSDGRYGQAVDYVIRLRPLGGESFAGTFVGPDEALERVRQALRSSSWNHWIDSMDLVVHGAGNELEQIAVSVDCLPGERRCFVEYLAGVAAKSDTVFTLHPAPSPPGLPALSIKATPSLTGPLAAVCVRSLGGHARVLLNNGVVLVYPEQAPDDGLLAELRQTIEPLGGHLYGTATAAYQPEPAEAEWAANLEMEWIKL